MMQTTKLYHKTGLVIIRDTFIQDIYGLTPNVRQSDKKEIWVSHHKTPKVALSDGFTESTLCLTVEVNGKPIAMFGIVARTILGKTAWVWLLASPELEKIQRILVKHSRYFIDIMLGYYPILENWVSCENMKSIKWLRHIGATIENPTPYGIEGRLFHHFYFRRKHEE